MALITAQQIGYAGTNPVYSAVNASDTFAPGNDVFLDVFNTNGATRDITIATTATASGGLAVADVVVTIAATTGHELIGPFPAQYFADSVTGLVTVTYSSATGVTAGLFRLSPVL
jgi:uncharacterized protein YfaS (alpha-2-macroglobulin family)